MPLIQATTADVDRSTLSRWAKEGRIVHVDRGIYIPAEESDQAHLELAAAVMRRPEAVVVLVSALHLHGIGTQVPHVIWLAVPPGVANHRTGRRVHILRWPKRFLTKDIETREIAGVKVRITTPARTIIDCWRCPRNLSHEAAIEALREGIAGGISRAKLAQMMERYHVASMRPYLEAVGA